MTRAALALLLVASAPAVAGDVATIRAGRAHSNAAILARDPVSLRSDYVADYTLIRGSSGQVVHGADAAVANFDPDFKRPGFGTYVRTPDRVVVSRPRDRAMERGHWVGTWHSPEAQRSGEYLAVWVPVDGGWKLRSESFVTLSETGNIPQ